MRNQQRHWCILLAMICAVILSASSRSMALVVSEVMYHSADDGETLEFVELYNERAVFEDLSGCAFIDGIEYVFEPDTILESRSYLVVARDPAALEAAYGITDALGPFIGRLSNDGERLTLANASGAAIISFRYDDARPWPVSPDGTSHSLILAKFRGDPEEGSTWGPSTLVGGTPGQPDQMQVEPEDPTLLTLIDVGHPGRYFKGAAEPAPGPGGEATTDWTQVEFDDDPTTTEWQDGPSGYGYSSEADELQYIGTRLDDMNGSYISVYARLRFTLTAEQIASFAQMQAEVHYDDDFVLYLNGARLGDSGQIVGDPPTFDQRGGQASDPAPAVVDLMSHLDLLIPGTNVLAIQAHNATLAGSSDCMGSPILRAIIAAPEIADDPRGRLLINEVLANSDAAPGLDWIELYNPGPIAVDLSNVYLSDNPADLLKYRISAGVTLAPGEFWTVREDELSFGLNFAGETICATAATGDPAQPLRVLDALHCETTPPDVTFGRSPDGSDRIGLLASATFDTSNAQELNGDIVINEIMYQHATSDERLEYVELYNRGTDTVALDGWAFTDGIDYTFEAGIEMAPDSYLVVAKNPSFAEAAYEQLTTGVNVLGPYSGNLNDHRDRIRLSYPLMATDPDSGQVEMHTVTADEVTYYDGGRWPTWADGQGASLELRDPRSNNNLPDAWADSDESAKTTWEQFSFTINGSDGNYTHDNVTTFGLLLLNRGEVLIDDLELVIDGSDRLTNNGFESNLSQWRTLGNHVQSFATTADRHSGSRALQMISSGHGDPGANRVNQSFSSVKAGAVTFRGWARWQRGTRFLLLRTTRDRSPVQPPRPAHAFELTMPLNLGTPGQQNTAFVPNRAPDICDVRHAPVVPSGGDPIVVTARVTDNDGVAMAILNYRSEGSGGFTAEPMVDDGTGDDLVAGDGLFTATIPGVSGGTMRAFYIEAFDGLAFTRFPARLAPSADVPERTCLVRVGDTLVSSRFATYRVWFSDDVRSTFRSRPNLSNQLMDCTFVYNDSEVFYNCGLRHRGSPFLRSGSGREPTPADRHGFRIDFGPDQRFGDRQEINLDGMEGGSRGPLQERASYWFYKHMGLHFSRQEYVRLIMNGRMANVYEDVQKIDGDYVEKWFPGDTDGYIHKVDDYFEYSSNGTGHSNLDEGLKFDSRHPLLKETYRWGFEKRSHRENDSWQHLFDFAVAMNSSSSLSTYEQNIESKIHPEHFAAVLAIRHAVGDWDSYGYNRGKNNIFYYAAAEDKWYLLPWDIDFTLGSGNGPSTNLFSVNSGQFPEVSRFMNYPKYEQMYWDALEEMVNGPWQTSYGTSDPPTAFDRFLDDAADALVAEGFGDGRRNQIKQFVRSRQSYILSRIPEQQDPEPDRPTR
jgi:CotH kinase protein/Lamin Tail Domain